MNFRTAFNVNNIEYELVFPVPVTKTEYSVCLVRKDSQEEILKINANHLEELPAISAEASKLLPFVDQKLFNKDEKQTS